MGRSRTSKRDLEILKIHARRVNKHREIDYKAIVNCASAHEQGLVPFSLVSLPRRAVVASSWRYLTG